MKIFSSIYTVIALVLKTSLKKKKVDFFFVFDKNMQCSVKWIDSKRHPEPLTGTFLIRADGMTIQESSTGVLDTFTP